LQNDVLDGIDDYSSDYNLNEEVQGRTPVFGFNKKVVNDYKDSRFLFGNNNLLNFLRMMSIVTNTVLVTTTSTITSATVKTCADASQFSATTACRRRRSVIDDFMADALVAPSPVEP